MDIRFYDFKFNLLYILPPNSGKNGYVSCNATHEFNGLGKFEIVFVDEELEEIIKKHKDDLMIVWDSFQGFLTGYQFDDVENTLFGQHLNGLIVRRVIQVNNEILSGDVESVARDLITKYYDFLTLGTITGFSNIVQFAPESYKTGDKIIPALLEKDSAGFLIAADITNKKYVFTILKSSNNDLILSENNLNVYEFSESYDNKTLVTAGWYKQKAENSEGEITETWACYNADESKGGIYKKEISLSADSFEKAKTEFAENVPFNEFQYKTKNISFGVDYKLGDVLRCQVGNVTIRKRVTSVNKWFEKEKGEQPVLSEV